MTLLSLFFTTILVITGYALVILGGVFFFLVFETKKQQTLGLVVMLLGLVCFALLFPASTL